MTDLLRKGPVWTQDEITAALARAGEKVTQATVSRDLAAIGALRGPDGYRLPDAPVRTIHDDPPHDELASLLRRHAVSIRQAHANVVVRTAPGHAQMLALALDHHPPKGVVGTVAGDDTILIATASPLSAERVTRRLTHTMNGGDS